MKIPKQIPLEMQKMTDEQLKSSSSKEDCLRRSYNILISKYQGSRLKTITKFFSLFKLNAFDLWPKQGFISCMQMNYLLKILLVKSGFFKEEDIKLPWVLLLTWRTFIHPHQYARVKINDNKYINVDIWAKFCGIEFGDYSHWAHRSTEK
jgi:hypothetical protein